jgi:hypothetical protein
MSGRCSGLLAGKLANSHEVAGQPDGRPYMGRVPNVGQSAEH